MVDVNSLARKLSVLKEGDIIMVYNGTSIALNISLWDSHFALPMFESTIYAVDKGTFMEYCGIGEMLLNLILNEEVRPFCGVNATNF